MGGDAGVRLGRGYMTPTVLRSELLRDGTVDRLDAEYFDSAKVEAERRLHESGGTALRDHYEISDLRVPDPRKDAGEEDAISYVEIGDIDTRDGFVVGREIPAREAPSRARMKLAPGMVALSAVRPARSQVMLVAPDQVGSIGSTGLVVLRRRKLGRLCPELLFVLLKTRGIIDQLDRRARASMYPTLHPPDVQTIVLPSVDAATADEIVELVQEATRTRARFLELSRDLQRVSEAFFDPFRPARLLADLGSHHATIRTLTALKSSSGLDRLDAEFHAAAFDELLDRMEECGEVEWLGNLLVEDGALTGASPDADEFLDAEVEGGAAVLKTGAMTGVGVNWAAMSFAPKEFAEVESNRLREGDVVFNSTAHQPKYMAHKIDVIASIPTHLRDRITFVSDLMRLRIADQSTLPPHYLAAFLRNPLGKEQIRRAIRGISSHVYPADICEIRVPLPAKEVATEIACIATEAESARWQHMHLIRTAIDRAENTDDDRCNRSASRSKSFVVQARP